MQNMLHTDLLNRTDIHHTEGIHTTSFYSFPAMYRRMERGNSQRISPEIDRYKDNRH
nr:MAG TPA: hypothetical protein [Caudoviricetes sp.]